MPSPAKLLEIWNRKLHYYLGLYLLFFLWLFALTGLILNHPTWTFADFWPTRHESTTTRAIAPIPPADDLTQARAILAQLGLTGEIEWTRSRDNPAHFDFSLFRPGRSYTISVDLDRREARLKQIDVNTWGVLRMLHTFTGVHLTDRRNSRDWLLTSLWAWSMDAVALGLIFMVLSSFYLWWIQKQKRRLGLVFLLAGAAVCAFYLFGLRLLY